MHCMAWQAQRNRGGGKGRRQRDKERAQNTGKGGRQKRGCETKTGWETKKQDLARLGTSRWMHLPRKSRQLADKEAGNSGNDVPVVHT